MSSRDTSTRVLESVRERSFVGPRDLRPPPVVRSQDLRDVPAGQNSSGRTVHIRPQFDLNVGAMDNSPGWAARDRMRLGPLTIDLTQSEYREIKQQGGAGRWTRALRMAYRIARRFVRGKDRRLDVALQILDVIFPWADASEAKMAAELKYGPGWTVGPICPRNPHHFDSITVWRSVSPCLDLQAAVGNDGTGPFLRYRDFAGSRYMQGLHGKWAFHPTIPDRFNHHQSAWTPEIHFPRGQPRPQPNMQAFQEWFPDGRYNTNRPVWAHGRLSYPRGAGVGGYHPPTKTRFDDPLPEKQRDKKFVIAVNNAAWYGRLISGVTEVVDFVDVAYDALGKKCGARTPQAKLACIYKNFHTMDWGKFLAGLVENQIEDYAWGRLGQITGKAARKAGRSTGYQLGPWDTEFSYHANGLEFTATI